MNSGVINKSIKHIEKTQLMTATAVIIATIGFKYVLVDFEDHCKIHFNTRLMKSITIFSLIFINTKNILVSIVFTIIYNIMYNILVDCDDSNK